MNAYIKLTTMEYPRYEGDIRLDHPDIPEDLTGATFPCPNDYAPVQWVDPPTFDSAVQNAEEIAPTFINGVWRMNWHVRQLDQASIDLIKKIASARGAKGVNGIMNSGNPPNVVV
jgi:hypothetical protein